ncbi:MAG: glutamate formimidoyltransferase [Bacteroidales bacterium]|jgi:glutamate formiminotransferase/formiminotetrahydrofolate cyclodeaminase|nr:glutamate formimidoyltransferase [Bacteroidales bacterium]
MKNQPILECVPNFSEGRDMTIIKQITDQIESVAGVKLLDVDPGRDTNRTVVTFVGSPESVCEAAFMAVGKAAELIDMSKHHGEHPRMGATDVCPLVPVSGITMEETVVYARKLAGRIGGELGIPVYCYENAAFEEKRRNLANCRAGEYEGLSQKLVDPAWRPDFGPAEFNARAGATAVGARDFLVAFNVNLNTTSTRRANAIAYDVREKGRPMREGNPITGKIVKDEQGNTVMVPGSLKAVKAIGWYIEEYGMAQISMNLTNISVTPVHIAFDEVCRKAETRGVRVTGSELVGLIPLKAILDAGRYFLKKQQRSAGVPDEELIRIAVRSMGLSDIHEFKPSEKIIEYVMGEKSSDRLVSMSLRGFMDITASESPAPGGGSVSSYVGALGVALGTMVANLSSHKRGWDERWEEFGEWAVMGKEIQNELLRFVDADTAAFKRVLEAYSLPKKNEEEKAARSLAIQEAIKYATLVPFRVMEIAFRGFEVIRAMVEKGNPNSITDAGVGALALRTCIRGAFLNVKVNAADIEDRQFVDELIMRGEEIDAASAEFEKEITRILKTRLG